MRILTIDDKYCSKCGHHWILVTNTTLYPEYYYCPNCDKIFVLTVKEVKKEEIGIGADGLDSVDIYCYKTEEMNKNDVEIWL